MSSCHVGRYFYWNFSDIHDHEKFPADTLKKAEQPFHFYEGDTSVSIQLPSGYNQEEKYSGLDEFLEKKKTVVFIIIRNDTILCERYFDGYSRESVIPGFSIVKSVISALMGKAIEEGTIRSVDDTVTRYLSGFKHEGFEKIRICDLLNMRSGIKFSESYVNPFGQVAKFYYGQDLARYTFNARIKEKPDIEYHYASINAQVAGMIIEKATGTRLPDYLETKIWSKIGTEFDASWSMDSREHGQTKAFCCLNATPLDFAKFGRLYLLNGQWDGKEVIPRRWVEESISITNDSRDSQGYPYHYFWRVLEDGSFFAKGVLGQFIYVYPDKKLIIIRFGRRNAGTGWIELFREIARDL